jgi:hypothetical protein
MSIVLSEFTGCFFAKFLNVLKKRVLWEVVAPVDSQSSLRLQAASFPSILSANSGSQLEEGAF